MTTRSNGGAPKVGVLLSGKERFSSYYGGALARWNYEVYARLTSSVDVTVFGYPTPEADRYALPHESGNWKACNLMARVPGLRRYEDSFWLRSLWPRLRKCRVLHVHNRPQWVGALRRLGYDGAIVLHLQNNHLGHWTPPMLDDLAGAVDAVVVCSGFLRNTFATKSAALAAKAQVIFNGVNMEVFSRREERREPKTIFFAGRFDPEKGVVPLLKAFARVLERHPDAKLVLGGATGFGSHRETEYVREARELARSITGGKPGKIEFTGYLHHDSDLPPWFQKAAVFVCPSIFEEPFGLVNAEAMACATPVVGSNRGGIPEVLGDTGLLASPEDSTEFASAICDLLSQPKERAGLGEAAQERCRQLFDWRIIAGQWRDLLQRVAKA